MTSTLTQSTQTTEALSYADRVTIASVLTWDSIGKTFSPDEIEAIRIDGEMVWVKLTQGSWPISRYMFRSILDAQRASINKQMEQIVEIEAQEVMESEREMDEIIHATNTQELHLGIDSSLTEAIGSNSNAIFGGFIEPSGKEIATFPVAENGYHDPCWTMDETEL
ncbi:MAG: hypothetical protein F6J86_38555 [Symploca sp. SIO1B1]|nr:hypothetical protein [Symploca sp. SIO1B1]